ncbi:hypothetical protein FQN60_007621 [Etheostoma spectabile]|uniref:Uncharacterized protein n=1 Tax=Etheostoma spectabile TaxID=54343 RepID=A0A5J5CUI5_9PERO|nr:hypothetical protein FQN60_007621 [Etheostoma spectabile]
MDIVRCLNGKLRLGSAAPHRGQWLFTELPSLLTLLHWERLSLHQGNGMFGPAGEIGQSVPSLSPVCPEPLWSQQTKPGRGGMHPLRLLLFSQPVWTGTASENTKTLDVSKSLLYIEYIVISLF